MGRNKTGTTSLADEFRRLGFAVGRQRTAELLADRHYFEGDFGPIIDYCRSAQVFQDVPFSYPGTFRHLDAAFPGSLFVLSVRDSAEQWYDSLVRYHARMFGNGNTPTAEQLRQARYVRKGWMYNLLRLYGTTDANPYDRDALMQHYRAHNREVVAHFAGRESQLLVLNIGEPDAYQRFLTFIGVRESSRSAFPWKNRSR